VADESDKTSIVGQRVFAGRWRIDGKLGGGGMGSVLLAFDLKNHTHAALKMLGVEHADNAEIVTRFEREARLLAKLDHPGLVPLIAVDSHEGVPFIVMKRLEGQTLHDLLGQRGTLPLSEVLPLVRQLASALDYLHSRGVVHRDLKPANIIVDANGRATIVDFGISQQSNVTRLTLPGLVVGTPMYMAPEQVVTDEVGPATDLYSLGLITWELLVGEHPFGHNDAEHLLVQQVMHTIPLASERNPSVPVTVAQVIKKALEKKPEARHATVLAFADELAHHGRLDKTTSEPDPTTVTAGDQLPTRVFEEQELVRSAANRVPTPLNPVAMVALVGAASALIAALWFAFGR
jgi:serine/threonine-protein kinase